METASLPVCMLAGLLAKYPMMDFNEVSQKLLSGANLM